MIENTVAAMVTPAPELMAWLGPAIGPQAFEVGSEVREQFLATAKDSVAVNACFRPANRAGHYFADIYALARLSLQSMGIDHIYGGEYCTVSQPERFFSYRRDGQTGRMVSLILINN